MTCTVGRSSAGGLFSPYSVTATSIARVPREVLPPGGTYGNECPAVLAAAPTRRCYRVSLGVSHRSGGGAGGGPQTWHGGPGGHGGAGVGVRGRSAGPGGTVAHRSGAVGCAAHRADHRAAADVAGPLSRRRATGRSGSAARARGAGPVRRRRDRLPGARRGRRPCSPRTSPRCPSGAAVEMAGAARSVDVRALVGRLEPGDAAVQAYAQGVAALAPAAAVLRDVRCAGRRRRRRAPADLHRRGVRAAAVPPDRAGDHRVGRGARSRRGAVCWPGTRVRPRTRTRRWPASSRSARAWRTRSVGRWPRRRA